MADTKLSALGAAGAIADADALYIVQGGTSLKTTAADIKNYVVSVLAAVATSGSASDLSTGTLPIARIADGAVTYAKIQNVSATDKLLGRSTAGAGVVEEIACTAAGRALIDDANASAQRTTLGLGTSAVKPANTLHTFFAKDNEPTSANYATLDFRNAHPVLDFDASTDESAVFRGILNRSYNGGGVTVRLIWTATSATSGSCRWAVAFERLADADTQTDDLDSDGFASAQTVGASPASGNAGQLQYTDIPFTHGAQMDSIAVGEMFRLKVTRDADGTSGTDDMAGDAELVGVEIIET